MKLLMWILLIVASSATKLQHDNVCLQHGSIRLKHDSICLQHDSICQVALAADTAQVTCIFSKDVYQEKIAFNVQMFAANSDHPRTVAACIWEAEDSLKPTCSLFTGIHLNESFTNVVAITVPINRLPAGGGRFVCQMVIQAGNNFLPCSWPDPGPQSTTAPGISNMSTNTEDKAQGFAAGDEAQGFTAVNEAQGLAETGEQFERTDSHYCNLAMGAHIFGTFIVTTLLNWLILVILWHKYAVYNRCLSSKQRTSREGTNTAEPEENGKLRSTESDIEV